MISEIRSFAGFYRTKIRKGRLSQQFCIYPRFKFWPPNPIDIYIIRQRCLVLLS